MKRLESLERSISFRRSRMIVYSAHADTTDSDHEAFLKEIDACDWWGKRGPSLDKFRQRWNASLSRLRNAHLLCDLEKRTRHRMMRVNCPIRKLRAKGLRQERQ
jgi:hypothetical protein